MGLRPALVLTWLATALVSAVEWRGQGTALLHQAGLIDGNVCDLLIGAGIALDLAVGLALWLVPGRRVYLSALIAMFVMTLAATYLLPSLWLNPLGPLLKNIPIAAALWVLMENTP